MFPVLGGLVKVSGVAGNVPPTRVKLPATGVTPAAVTFGSAGIASVEFGPLHVRPAHGSAVATVRLKDVR